VLNFIGKEMLHLQDEDARKVVSRTKEKESTETKGKMVTETKRKMAT
jgi:hypothetical protein